MKYLIVIFILCSVAEGKTNQIIQSGRFQLIQLGEFRSDQYMIDSQTGKVWRVTCTKVENGSCQGTWLSKTPVEGIDSAKYLNDYINSYDKKD